MQAAIDDTRQGLVGSGMPNFDIGQNQAVMGKETLLRSRGVLVALVPDATCIALMRGVIARKPELWNVDIGEEAHWSHAHQPADPQQGADRAARPLRTSRSGPHCPGHLARTG